MSEYWKTACQTVWGNGFRAGSEKFHPKFKSERRPFISILNFNNFIINSMLNIYLSGSKIKYSRFSNYSCSKVNFFLENDKASITEVGTKISTNYFEISTKIFKNID